MDIQTELFGNVGRRYVRNNRIKLRETQTRLHVQFKGRIRMRSLTYQASITTEHLFGNVNDQRTLNSVSISASQMASLFAYYT
jgi:hypothetical protein